MEMQQFYYDNKIVKKIHLRYHSFWVVGMLVDLFLLYVSIPKYHR
jgi:hypothetical protein